MGQIAITYCIIVILFFILFVDWRFVCDCVDDPSDEYIIV